MNVSDPSFHDVFVRDMADLEAQGPLGFVLMPSEWLTLCAHAQLALRHPGNRGSSARQAAETVGKLIDLLATTDVLRAGLEAGNDERHDVPSSAARRQAVVRPQKVCLCGSTRFYEAFQEANYRETMCGRMVYSVGFYPRTQKVLVTVDGCMGQQEALVPVEHGSGVGCTPEQKRGLDELHLRKIDDSDQALFLNVDDYLGESSLRELAYARSQGKRVRWWRLPSRHALPGEGE